MMSLLSCATLLLVLFACFQNNTCCARPHAFEAGAAIIVLDEDTSQKYNLTDNKNDDHMSNHTARKDLLGLQTTSSGIRKPSKMDSNNDNIVKVVARSHKRRSSMKMINRQAKTGGGGSKVSYRVPHRKRGEQQPGFNLDYSPPKPSHFKYHHSCSFIMDELNDESSYVESDLKLLSLVEDDLATRTYAV